jgi:hypothetical protein
MYYLPIGDKSVQNWIDMLGIDSTFGALSEAQQIQYINFGQQECVNLSKKNSLNFYKATEDMCLSESLPS